MSFLRPIFSPWFLAAIMSFGGQIGLSSQASASVEIGKIGAWLGARGTVQKMPSGHSIGPVLDQIAHSTNRVQQLRIEWVINLRAQSTDRYFHDVCIAIEVHIPYVLGQYQA